MIDFQNIYKSYGAQELLIDTSFRINSGEHVGIVGANGSGKSTIFSLIIKDIEADKGTITMPKDKKIGYLRQHLDTHSVSLPLINYTEDAIPELKIFLSKIHDLEHKLHSEQLTTLEKDKILEKIGNYQTEFEHLGGYNIRTRAETALSGLGFSTEALNKPLATFSGGWQMRAALAKTLISDPDILLLDEPSNYLDIPAVEWLQKFLRNYQGTLLLISHDRYLLKILTGITFEINNAKVTRYAGDYDYYTRERESRKLTLEASQKNQNKKIEQIEKFVDRFRYKATKANQVQSRMKMLDKIDRVNLSTKISYSGNIKFPPPPKCGNEIISMEAAGLTYDTKTWVLKNVDLRIENGEKIGIIGYNGTGKTTLLRMLAEQLPLSAGKLTIGHNVVIGYQSQEFGEILSPESTVFDTVRAVCKDSSKIRALLGNFGFTDVNVNKPCKVLSGGEKIKLLFARIFANPPNFLVLDEPTTHLDIHAREKLQEVLKTYKGTVCIVSHDIEFTKNVASTIISMTPQGIKKFYGNYEYFLEKNSSFETKSKAGESKPTIDSFSSKEDQKRKRQQKAAIRQQLNARKKVLDKKVTILEKKIEMLEEEKESLHNKLLETGSSIDFPSINKRLKEVNVEIHSVSEDWEASAIELEEFTEQYNSAIKDI